MYKKRFLLAILLVAILIFVSSDVLAGCCQGIIGCSRAFFDNECSSLATFDPQECEDLQMCDIVACCHNIPGVPKSTYRSTCLGMTPTPTMYTLKPFTTNPSAESATADYSCQSPNPPCSFVSCEKPNADACMCGSTSTSTASQYCCAKDSSVFPSFGACSSSPSCRAGTFYNVRGRVTFPSGVPIAGAEVSAGGKTVITDENGNFSIDLLPDQSSGTVLAKKNNTVNSTNYAINGQDVTNLLITLNIPTGPVAGVEDCTNGWDDNGNQFYWNSTFEGIGNVSDRCDSDCGAYFLSTFGVQPVKKTVSKQYYSPKGELYTDSSIHDFCADRFDNDCDGLADCEDADCFDKSPACKKTFCGDGTIQFPNAEGIYEQCDVPAPGEGNDSLCPGNCIAPGKSGACTCKYEVSCGNNVIDEPLEDCDGIFVAARDEWDPAKFNTASECTIDACGKPTSTRPCQCPPPQVCGNNIVEAPEGCDGSACPNGDACSPDCTCPPAVSVCGNNIIEKGEDCEGTVGSDKEWATFKTRKYGCSKTGCPIPSSYFASPEDYTEYLSTFDGVDAGCKCKTDCKQSPPGPKVTSIGQTRWQRAINVNWTDECMAETAKAFNVFRCEASSINGTGCKEANSKYSIINEAPLGLSTTYADTTFRGSLPGAPKFYCYYVQGVYGGGMVTSNNIVPANIQDMISGFFDPKINCVQAGMEECFSFKEFYPWAEEFCSGLDYNTRSTCDASNLVVPVNASGERVNCSISETDFSGKSTEFACVGPYSKDHQTRPGKTECVPKSLCDMCNDPFGLFSYSRTTSTTPKSPWSILGEAPYSPIDFGKAPKRPPTDSEKLSRATYMPCYSLQFCYMDYSSTNVNRFYQYKPGSTCYDYHSLQACKKFNETDGNCEWVWHPLYRELGVGVCRTNITDRQDCERCHDPMNEVFGRCDRDSCALYGRCYYDRANLMGEEDYFASLALMTPDDRVKNAQKEGSNFYKCTHERNISCENYDSQEDCIGSHSPYSIQAEKNITSNAIIDAYGNMTVQGFNKLRGSNKVTKPSDDFFGFSKCQWVVPLFTNTTLLDETGKVLSSETSSIDPFCVKNADNSLPLVTIETGYGYAFYQAIQDSDCGTQFMPSPPSPLMDVLPNVRLCWKDFDNPFTNIPHYDDIARPMRISGHFKFKAAVKDASLDYAAYPYYPTTYGCVAEKGRDCYPQGVGVFISPEEGNLVAYDNVNVNTSYNFSERGFQSSLHLVKYFSEDISHNLEEVRNFTVYIDADAPNMVFQFSNVSWELHEDVWRTNLTIEMRVVPRNEQDDKYAFCNAKMYIGNVSIYGLQDIVNEYNDTWSRLYEEMPDDYYTFSYSCEDDVGNVAAGNITILIDGDKALTNPQPRGTFNHGDLGISIETGTNAECRYLYSAEDIPAFAQNITFDPAIFDTMTLFTSTGAADKPASLHAAAVNLGSGYHRYYVKCKQFVDGKIRGNNADQIRFAVDMVPPVSSHSTNVEPYANWYNQDVKISIACGDPFIMGNNLDWSFGCNKSFYCLGKSCSEIEGEFREYTESVGINKTDYISYYSVDKGENKEALTKDVLFQIDKEPANLTIEFFDGDNLATVLIMNTVYEVKVSASKPFISASVAQPRLAYSSQPSKFGGNIELFPTDDDSVWEGVFFIENINANRGFEGDGIFSVSSVDYHNVSASSTILIKIDTKPPDAPIIDPSLESPSRQLSAYQAYGYPVNYYNGTYYTKSASLFITGYTNEYLNMIAVTTVDDVSSEKIFTQTPTNLAYNDSVISGFLGGHEIKLVGDITKRVNSSLYIGFDTEQKAIGPKVSYGNYGMFYDITNLIYHGGDEQYTSVIVYPTLEQALKVGRKIFFYDKENPSYWFGFDLPLAMFKNTSFYLKSYDQSHNLVRYPDISNEPAYLVFFSDPIAPKVVNHYPREGSTSKVNLDVGITVKEGRGESGLFRDRINFTVNGKGVQFTVENDDVLESYDTQNEYFKIYYSVTNIPNGVYDVSITGYDLAMNTFDEDQSSSHWTFIVDRNLPADPEFSILGGFRGPPGDTRWYVSKSPDFIVDFSAERNPVTITDIVMEDSPTEGGAATCKNTSFNVFKCEFTSPKTAAGAFWSDYGVIVKAFKTLGDGTNSNTGSYGPFQFTVDDQPPSFIPAFQNRFMDNINLTIGALVSNENHPLFVDVEIFGEHYTPLYSSNNGSFYYFTWNIPDFAKDKEGPTTLRLTLSDFAGNSRSMNLPVYVDLTAPRIENISISVSNTVQIGKELFTAQPNVTVSGNFIDDDIESVWILPGDYNETTKIAESKKNAEIKRVGGVPESFKVSVKLIDPGAGKAAKTPVVYNYMLINQINSMTIYVKDIAGHVSRKSLRVITDFAPPISPFFCLGEDLSRCMPNLLSEVEEVSPAGADNGDKVTICHVANNNTLSISPSALQAHLDQGDYEGVCV